MQVFIKTKKNIIVAKRLVKLTIRLFWSATTGISIPIKV